MKSIFLILLALGFAQGSSAFGQEEGGLMHGHAREEGGLNNSGSSRVNRDDAADHTDHSEVKIEKKEKIRPARVKNQDHSNPNHRNNFEKGASSPRNENHVNSMGGENHLRILHGVRTENFKNNNTSAVSPKFRTMGITHIPSPMRDRSKILRVGRARSVITLPRVGMGGAAIGAKVIAPRSIGGRVVVSHMTAITRNAAFTSQINIYNRGELVPNHYYWHTGSGFNYCHYYDNWGYHWYGWYLGSSCFWTRYYENNWWWYDNAFDRWCYWHDGGWWWQDPSLNVVYVYNDGAYLQAQDSSPQTSSPSNSNDPGQVVYQSNDGTRKVKVMSGSQDAFLYDAADSPSFDPVYLATGVKDVKFSDTSSQKPLQVILTLNDGTFQMFDAYGNPYGKTGGGTEN